MPTKPYTSETLEINRRQEWEDREYWSVEQTRKREHELALLDVQNKLALAKHQATVTGRVKSAKVNLKLRRLVVVAIFFLNLFKRPVPDYLVSLLDT